MSERSRLLWRCRRGTQELDILFQDFIDRHYEQLSAAEKSSLDSLLDQADPDILSWVMGKSDPPPGDIERIVHLIRAARMDR